MIWHDLTPFLLASSAAESFGVMPPFINFSLRIFWPLVNEIFEIKTEQQLDEEWYKHKSNEYTETIEQIFAAFEEELEEHELIEIRQFLLNTLYENLSDFEYFFKKIF